VLILDIFIGLFIVIHCYWIDENMSCINKPLLGIIYQTFIFVLIWAFYVWIEKLKYLIRKLRIESQNLGSFLEILSWKGQFVQYWNMPSYSNYQYLFHNSYQSILLCCRYWSHEPLCDHRIDPHWVKNKPHSRPPVILL
jgi:hypothetical protein